MGWGGEIGAVRVVGPRDNTGVGVVATGGETRGVDRNGKEYKEV